MPQILLNKISRFKKKKIEEFRKKTQFLATMLWNIERKISLQPNHPL